MKSLMNLILGLWALTNAHFCLAEEPHKAELQKLKQSIQTFKKSANKEGDTELKEIKDKIDLGYKALEEILQTLVGTKDQVKKAIADYRKAKTLTEKIDLSWLLISNYMLISANPSNANLKNISGRFDFSDDEWQTMKDATESMNEMTDTIKKYLSRLSPEQIKSVIQDNPHPIIPRLVLFQLGPEKNCTLKTIQKIKSELGDEAFKKLRSLLNATGHAYEGLYEPLYTKRTIEILQKDSSPEAKLVKAWVSRAVQPGKAQEIYESYLKLITKGEDEFIKIYGSSFSRKEARLFFQGFARKYPTCLGVFSPEYFELSRSLVK